jgi:hypothetical protein
LNPGVRQIDFVTQDNFWCAASALENQDHRPTRPHRESDGGRRTLLGHSAPPFRTYADVIRAELRPKVSEQ